MLLLVGLLLAINPPSAACISCHEDLGVTAMPSQHPYSIAYAPVAQANPRRYRSAINAADYLIDGDVACGSCHIPHVTETTNPYRLRTRDLVKLCTACHVMQE